VSAEARGDRPPGGPAPNRRAVDEPVLADPAREGDRFTIRRPSGRRDRRPNWSSSTRTDPSSVAAKRNLHVPRMRIPQGGTALQARLPVRDPEIHQDQSRSSDKRMDPRRELTNAFSRLHHVDPVTPRCPGAAEERNATRVRRPSVHAPDPHVPTRRRDVRVGRHSVSSSLRGFPPAGSTTNRIPKSLRSSLKRSGCCPTKATSLLLAVGAGSAWGRHLQARAGDRHGDRAAIPTTAAAIRWFRFKSRR
jgi:hypothetical protein